jgi:hypothetical protein
MSNKKLNLTAVKSYFPTITIWNRLEGRPRAENFDRALKAEVRDALWMISKQWQMGEFIGDDAASPVLTKIHISLSKLTKYQPGSGDAVPLEQDIPLEVKVENQKIPFKLRELEISLDLRLLMGRQWLKYIGKVDSTLRSKYIDKYKVHDPNLSGKENAQICAHVRVWQQFSAAFPRCMDGYKLYHFLKDSSSNHAYDDISGVDNNAKIKIDEFAVKFIHWFENIFYQSIEQKNPSWKPEYLEYGFSCSSPKEDKEKVLIADEYYHGHLDWYNLDINNDKAGLEMISDQPLEQETFGSITQSLIPTSITFGGMPHPRWWTFENWKTNLSFIEPDTTDLNKLLLLDFILLYSNDWFMFPLTLPLGSIANVEGLMVTNVFGEKIWIDAAGKGSDEDWQRWNMFTLNIKGTENVEADMSMVLLPAVRKVLEGKPVEEVYLIRDEIANMVWGVESIVPLANGKSKSGREAGYELRTKLQQILDSATPGSSDDITFQAAIRYQIVNSVPEQWIPFIPVHLDNSSREIQLQRASMPRILKNDPGVPLKIEPRTFLLREGLDKDTPQQYFVHEEEVPRSGIKVEKSFRRTRWYNGKVYNWLGIRKQVGRGEGRSGLAFDQILPVEQKSE